MLAAVMVGMESTHFVVDIFELRVILANGIANAPDELLLRYR
jgi:hypothetical protein